MCKLKNKYELIVIPGNDRYEDFNGNKIYHGLSYLFESCAHISLQVRESLLKLLNRNDNIYQV
jgi:hypothetical protein